jgi:hypothetical protein
MRKRAVTTLILFLFPLLLASCIVRSKPDGNSLTLSPSDLQWFEVVGSKPAFPSNSSLHYNWSIDGDFKVDNPTFYYSPAVSDVGNVVVIKCTVVVTNDRTGAIISSDERKWDITVTP